MHHRTTTTVTTLILCACLLLTGCSARARQRDLIRKDPLASATWDGIDFLGSMESEDGSPKPAHRKRGCRWFLKPLVSSSDRAM